MDKIESISFEMIMRNLDLALKELEKSDIGLEESMEAYEMGIKLVREAEGKLKNMESRMEELMSDGTIAELKLPEGNQ